VLAVLTGALGGAVLAERCGCLALDLWNVPEYVEQLRRAHELDRALATRDGTMWRSIMGKDEATREVIAGRLGLRDAAALFRELAASVPDYPYRQFWAAHPGACPEESFCRAVIYFVEFEVADEPGGPELVKRLEDELCELLQAGTLELPRRPDLGCLRLESSAAGGPATSAGPAAAGTEI
jgi:hypothetical protein